MRTANAPVEPNLSTFQSKHFQLLEWIADPTITNILAAGGRRSGKTIAIITGIFLRAMRAPGSTHGFFHSTRTSVERNLFKDNASVPETINILLPGWFDDLRGDKDNNYINYSDLTIKFPNGSKFLFMGLDDPYKLRGLKFSTIFVNEANHVGYETIMTLGGSLSESVKTVDGVTLPNKMIYDLNPTVKSSWDHKVFVEGVIPGDTRPITHHDKFYRYLTINPIDNKANLPETLFQQFEAMTEEQRRRDEHGMWSEDNPSALFNAGQIGRKHAEIADMAEIVVAIDPAGTSGKKSDSTGIIVAGRGYDEQFYVFEDATVKAKPSEWLHKAENLRVGYDGNWLISEIDYARDILEELIDKTIPNAPIKYVASRGRNKRLRAEPIASLYVQGRVNHVPNKNPQMFRPLEQQMVEFDAPGYPTSPDRVDALVYALQHLASDKPAAPLSIGRVGNFMG